MRSSKFCKDVVPTMGAEMKSLESDHASATWAMEIPLFLAISSILLKFKFSCNKGNANARPVPFIDGGKERINFDIVCSLLETYIW